MMSKMKMIGVGKVYDNLMVDLKPTNQKLIHRSIRIIKEICDLNDEEAKLLYEKADKDIKTAIVMNLSDITKDEAQQKLLQHKGVIKQAIKG